MLSSETPPPPSAQERPQVTYKAPDGWQQQPSDRMNAVQFSCATAGGNASVNITPLESMAGKEMLLINMWRGAIGQPELPEAEALEALIPVSIGAESGQMFEVAGKRESEEISIITAFVHHEGKSWFFKLQGTPAAVAAQKAAFVEFLKTVQIQSS